MNKPASLRTILGYEYEFDKPFEYDYPVEEIAHALSMLCRYGGHSPVHYSVAQHSVLASYIVDDEFALTALLHDAAEAYLGDMVAPLKALIPEYRNLEAKVQYAIHRNHGSHRQPQPEVKKADLVMLATEKRDVLKDEDGSIWASIAGVIPLPITIVPMTTMEARTAFMERYTEIKSEY